MEEDRKYLPPILDVSGKFIVAPDFTTALVAKRTNERLARKMDAAKLLDELERGLWYFDEPGCEPSFRIRKRLWKNQEFHFRDEEK